MGNVALVEGRCATNQQINSLTKIEAAYNPYYIYYWLKGKKDFLFQQASVTRTPILNKTDFSNIKIDVPNREHQDKVASFLVAIDKKIELNNKINKELEAMAKLIYDYWFVQFDFPDANGKPYKSSGGTMVYNEELKREIPDGWDTGCLLDIAEFANGVACQQYRPEANEDSYKVIKIREMTSGFTGDSDRVSKRFPEKLVVRNGDVLFSWSATLNVQIWSGGIGGLNQHIFKLTSKKFPRTFYYFETLRYLQHFEMMAKLRKTTMGHITQDHLEQSRIPIPPDPLIQSIHKSIDPMLNRVVQCREENLELARLRDWLLPMLMNGQVTVDDSR
jgi:type I restriction enzyme, S subunit